MINIGHQLYL